VIDGDIGSIGLQMTRRSREQGRMGNVPIAPEQDPYHAGRSPAQAVGILRSAGNISDQERADQIVNLLGERDARGDIGRGQRRVRPLGQVVLAHGHDHLRILPLAGGVLRAHIPLQFGNSATSTAP